MSYSLIDLKAKRTKLNSKKNSLNKELIECNRQLFEINESIKTAGKNYNYNEASQKMGHMHISTTIFIVNAIEWLGEKFGYVDIQYDKETSEWYVLTSFRDHCIYGNGSIESALCQAVEDAPLP